MQLSVSAPNNTIRDTYVKGISGNTIVGYHDYFGDADQNGMFDAGDFSLAEIGDGTATSSQWLIAFKH